MQENIINFKQGAILNSSDVLNNDIEVINTQGKTHQKLCCLAVL